jgi:hypothetical protein
MSIPSLGQQGSAKSAAIQSQNAVTVAYTAVSFWTGSVKLALLEPAALFALCHNTQPKPLADNSGWQWTISDANFSATLVGKVIADSARWTMSVSGGNLSNFVWYTGTSTITGNAGYWIFHDTTAGYPASILLAYDVTTLAGACKVQVIKAGDPNFGSYLGWAAIGDVRTFTGYDATNLQTITIVWNNVTEAGTIINQTTGEHYCWDTKANNHQDISCN